MRLGLPQHVGGDVLRSELLTGRVCGGKSLLAKDVRSGLHRPLVDLQYPVPLAELILQRETLLVQGRCLLVLALDEGEVTEDGERSGEPVFVVELPIDRELSSWSDIPRVTSPW